MNKKNKILLLATLAATTARFSEAAYTGNLLVGVYQSSAASTTVFDLGAFSSLSNGETWDLSGALSDAGVLSLSGAQFGVVGYKTGNAGNPGSIYSTTLTLAPQPLNGNSAVNQVRSDVATLGNNLGSQGVNSGADWFTETINTAPGATFLNDYGNPNVGQGSTALLYTTVGDNSLPTLDGSFSLAPNGTLSYTVSPVPEPSTYGLFALGMAGLALGRQFRRQRI